MVKIKKPKAIICDIEGTTTSVKFWGECLMPFVKTHVHRCLKERWDVPIVSQLIDNLRKSTSDAIKEGAQIPGIADNSMSKDLIIKSVADSVIEQINSKMYGRALQHIQMYVCLYGYQTDKLKGHVFNDVSGAFNKWQKFYNLDIYTFASGVYLTQKMLFTCSVRGNLTPLIKDFFDVESIGPKTKSESYRTVSQEIGQKCEDMLFFSDNPKELTAAEEAGCKVVLVIRPFNVELTEEETTRFPQIKSFEEIYFI